MSDIAIVGIDCRFPQAADKAALWKLLMDGADAITDVPADRWQAADFFNPAGGPGTVNNRTGGFLTDADAFDHEFFAVSPREAQAMDPQQRLLLQAAWRALEDATLDPRAQTGSATGVFVGVMANEWATVHMSDFARITPQLGSGNGYFMTANRLSYQLDLKGPSIAVDTACSSSLVAVHLACVSLRAGECDQALAGGVNMILTPALNVFYTQAGLSAPDGRCKPFSAKADGIGRGEGVAVLVLRRLEDALAAGLPVYAVIKGGAVNSDGRSNGITAPNRWAQQQAVAEAYRRAGVRPEDVTFLETHGTGTVLGDMIEVKALGHVHGVPRSQPCAIGSIKGNLGHTEGAAGIAGLIKVALALHHRVVPPTRYAPEENRRLRLTDQGLRLLSEPLDLPAGVVHGGVSSFGLGGTNAHLLLASAPETAPMPPVRPGTGVLTVSASDRAGLQRNAAQLAEDLAGQPAERLAQLCWTSNQVKASGRYRLAIPVGDRDQAVAALREAAADETRLAQWSGAAPHPGLATGWLFTGQGSQYPGMSRALHESLGAYRRALAEVDEAMSPHLGRSVRELVLGDDEVIHRTGYAQPAIFAVQYALAKVLTETGIEPAWLAGHSVGEYAAATLAGVFGLDEACRLITARGRLMQALPEGGAMLAVRSAPAEVADLLAAEPLVDLAAVNGPADVVLSGAAEALGRIAATLSARGVATRALAVSHAFHSPLMEPVLDAFAEVAAGCTFRLPNIPVYSTLRGRLLAADEPMDAAYWTEHIRATVRFADAVTAGLEADPTHLIEVGPRRILAPLVTRLRPDRPVACLTPCPGPDAGGQELAQVAAALYRDGLNPVWDVLYEPEHRVRRRLSAYRFSTSSRFWMQTPDHTGTGTARAAEAGGRESQPVPVPRTAAAPVAPAAPSADARRAAEPVHTAAPTPLTPDRPKAFATMDNLIALFQEQAATFREQTAILAALTGAGGTGPVAVAASPLLVPALPPAVAVQAPGDCPTPQQTPAGMSAQAVSAKVIAETARVSGFPADALKTSQTLTDDLGFDSIMITDLVGGLTRAFPELHFEPTAFSPSATLGEMIAYVTEQVGAPAPPPATTRANAAENTAEQEAAPDEAVNASARRVAPSTADYRIEEFPEVKAIADRLGLAEAMGVSNPYFLVNDGVTRDTSIIGGDEVVNFSSYNYLGMSGHPAVVKAVQEAVASYGSSCSASRLLSGEKPVHRELEAELAGLLGTEDAIALVSGHATNVTVIGHLVGPEDLVIHDALAHDSIIQGCKLSGATRRPFPHNDHAALDAILDAIRHQYRRVLVLIEGVYSQDGDIPDLPAFIAVKKKHQSLLMIDEAHSIGVLGAKGGGIGEYFDIDRRDVELWSGTMSKSLAGCGGYVGGSHELIRFLKYTTPGFIYSVGITPPNAAASLAAIRQMRAEPELIARLNDRSRLFLQLAKEAGINTGDSHDTPVIPCIVGASVKTLKLSNALLGRGINVNPILYPAVPEDLARLRFFVTACHSEEQIRYTVRVVAEELAALDSAG